MSEEIGHWIGGSRVPGASGRTQEVFDPATGEVDAHVALACADEVADAVASAREAYTRWSTTPLSKRTRVLFRFRELLVEHRRSLAEAVSREHGKVIADAAGEVQRGLEVVEFACGIPQLLKGGHSHQVSGGVDAYEIRQSVGVCAGISPFNFPVMVPMWMHPLAIACGNSFVLKPSERDPSASLLVAELWTEAGLPDGVFNVVNGDKEAVDALLRAPGVDAVSFVGSTPVAREIYRHAADRGIRVQALGGAKNHMVVLEDADVDTAADAAVSAGYGSAGERCMAISVIVAVGGIGDPLVDAIRSRTEQLVVGPGSDPDSQMGPLITREHRDRVSGLVDAGVREGAELVVDGRGLEVADHPSGHWLGPCLFDRADVGMSIYTEEIFGPVLVVLRVESYEEALALVNSNPYGNGTAIFTTDGAAARDFEANVEAGMVGVNVPIPVPMAYYSFGGQNQSLFGDSHMHGTEGVHFYTRTKTVTRRWPETAHRSDMGLAFPS